MEPEVLRTKDRRFMWQIESSGRISSISIWLFCSIQALRVNTTHLHWKVPSTLFSLPAKNVKHIVKTIDTLK